MRRVSKQVCRGVALLAITAVLVAPTALADEGWPYEPPKGRISPPVGAPVQSSSDSSLFAEFFSWRLGRISPPVG
jgi:hypothetical protein